MVHAAMEHPVTGHSGQSHPTDAGRRFWTRVLRAGGSTAIPRWTLDPIAGEAEYGAALPEGLQVGLRRVAADLGVPLSAMVLTAHARVLAALSGDSDVVIGYVTRDGGRPLPCRLTTQSPSWRTLLSAAHAAESELRSHQDFPLDDLLLELSVTGPSYETVLSASGVLHELPPGVVLGVAVPAADDCARLGLRFRTEALDREAVVRIAGYHLTALQQLVDDPDADPLRLSLLSSPERQLQLEGLAGRRRDLPDRRAHELFEQQASAHPDYVAAVHQGQHRTYAQLNGRANRIARGLLSRGLGREEVVGVVTERNLDWMAAVLAIFKAGGVYLPIEPHFPADRVAATLSRAGSRLVLTEPGSRATLDQALESLPEVEALLLDAVAEEHDDSSDVQIAVEPGQLAYIYFTSGSTGQPKGAMCEHAGMLNHLYAKIDDLQISAESVVAQTAPQCFDISLWQLISALLVGGRTLIVEQEAILDVPSFVDTISEGHVSVLQVVPSYLEAVLSYLELHPGLLSHLHHVSVTGEALKKALTQRWFALEPGIRLVNAYGLTETSDDTNHEIMDRVPDGDSVPLGPPVNNVHVYVVDEQLSPVPLGAPGEIVFSGVCVGRGYVNDPERTRLAFMPDPHRVGARLYRSGDFGRWRPDGKLEFLGRRDTQVKISGFRIEIGEIENTLLRVPGVSDSAVVVTEGADRSRHLVGFYSSPQHLDVASMRDLLGRSLPEYMVPSALHRRERLPLTGNGKVDKKALAAVAGELEVDGHDYQAPRTASERKLAMAWAKVLGVAPEQIGRRDHFFDRGGTSLSAVKLAVALDREVSLKDVTRHPVLADLASVIDDRNTSRSGLLQLLSEPDRPAPGDGFDKALVCFPYAGGNAVNFQPMAGALRGSGLAVFAVELPGHDVAAEREPFAPLVTVVDQVVDELLQRGVTKLLLWGHSAGSAFAVETAQQWERRGLEVERLFLGAQLPGEPAGRRAAIDELTQRANADILADLSAAGGYTQLTELTAAGADPVAAAYRHDCISANAYFAEALATPPAARISAPVTVVVAADDPNTPEYQLRHLDWQVLAERVELYELAEGGHYFLRTSPSQAAHVVLRAAELPASP